MANAAINDGRKGGCKRALDSKSKGHFTYVPVDLLGGIYTNMERFIGARLTAPLNLVSRT